MKTKILLITILCILTTPALAEKLSIKKNSTSIMDTVYIQDSTTGAAKTNLTYTDVTCFYYRPTTGATPTSITLKSCTLGTFDSGCFIKISDSNMPGFYQIHLPNAALATGVNRVDLHCKGTGIYDVVAQYALTDFDLQSATVSLATGGIAAATIADGALTASKFAEDGVSTSGSDNTITLSTSTSSDKNDYYKGNLITIVAETGSGQSRCINSYVGATRVATVNFNWVTNPDNTSKYAIISGSGTCDTTVGSLGSGAITSSTFASGAITADAIATNAIGADEFSDGAAAKTWATATRTLSGTQTFNNTGTWTGNLNGNVTGNVGGSCASITGTVNANMTQIAGFTTPVSNLNLMFNGTGYAGGTTKLGVNVSDKTGYSCSVVDKTGFSLANGSIISNTFAAGAINAGTFSTNAITAGAIADNAITDTKLTQSAANKVWASTLVGGATKNVNNVEGTVSTLSANALTAIGTAIGSEVECSGEVTATVDVNEIAGACAVANWNAMRSAHKIKGSFGEGVPTAPTRLR